MSKLENALKKLQAGNVKAAEAMLRVAMIKLSAASGKQIDPEDAADGIAEIAAIINLIQNPC